MKKNVQKDAVMAVSRELSQKGYLAWIEELKKRYRATQIKAAVAVNSALIEFYWNLGKDISEKYPGKVRDAQFFRRLSADLRIALPEAKGLSPSSIKYTRYFYELYSAVGYRQQPADDKRSKLGLPMGITDYELKKVLPTQAQLAKCYADAEKLVAKSKRDAGK